MLMKPFGGIRTWALLNIWVGGRISWVCDIHQLQPYLHVISFQPLARPLHHSLWGRGLLFLEAETHPKWTIFQKSPQRTPLPEQLALGVGEGTSSPAFTFNFSEGQVFPLFLASVFRVIISCGGGGVAHLFLMKPN